jgi:hypothetical protein
VNVYSVAGVNPVTKHSVIVAPVVVHVCPPVELVTVCPVIAEPPSDGAVQDTVADVWPVLVAVTFVGADGTVAAAGVVIGLDGPEGSLAPEMFAAVTVNVYSVAGVNPLMTHEASVAPVVVHVCPPVELVTVYPVTGQVRR